MRRVIALVLVVVLLAGAVPASAQEPTPTPVPLLVPEINGVQDAAIRSFIATGFSLASPIYLTSAVVEFDSDEHTHDAMPIVRDRYLQSIGQNGDVSGIKKTSAKKIGDETIALSGPLKVSDPDVPITELACGLVVVRHDRYVLLVGVGSIGGDSIGAALGTARAMVEKHKGGDVTPTDADGMRTGGLWAMLPTLDDIPEGLTFAEERVPVPFAPLPGQDTTPTPLPTEPAAAPTSPTIEPIAFRHTGRVAQTWSVKVLRTFDDPHQIDPSATWFSDWLDHYPLAAGKQFFTVRLHITNRGEEAARLSTSVAFGLSGRAGYIYDSSSSCGSVPGQVSFMDDQLRPGEALDTNLCWVVSRDDIGSLVLYGEPWASYNQNDRVSFALA
ncbi:MAG: DUF4352 domain-containing protein [Thermomicrobiales bacterium]